MDTKELLAVLDLAIPKVCVDIPEMKAWCERLKQARAAVAQLVDDNERMQDALEQVSEWAKAYPLTVFPEPDFKRVHEVLQAAGMTLDSVSASNMRHVITRVQKIVDDALLKEKTS